MKREEAITIISKIIKLLAQTKPRGTGIRADNVKGLIVKNSKFTGLERALDATNSQDITWERNIVDNYAKYSELKTLLESYLEEASKRQSQVNKAVLVKIRDEIFKRWPELVGTALATAMLLFIKS